MAREFGKYGTAINEILRFLKEDAHVSNADDIVLDGELGEQSKTAIRELNDTAMSFVIRDLTDKLRAVSDTLGTSAYQFDLIGTTWTNSFDKFVDYLNEQAAAEEEAIASMRA